MIITSSVWIVNKVLPVKNSLYTCLSEALTVYRLLWVFVMPMTASNYQLLTEFIKNS